MLATERHRIIENMVRVQRSVTIEQLLVAIPVSKMTMWRDLTKLDRMGRLKKVHGGAHVLQDFGQEPGFDSKSSVNGELKDRIAKTAAMNFINENDVVILEGGTTVMHMVQHIDVNHVSILTNGLNTLLEAAKLDSDLTVMICGGILRKPSLTFVGPEAQKFFESFTAAVLFLSGTGFSKNRGLTDPNPLEIEIKNAMIRCAKKLVVLIDSSKFGIESLKTVANLDGIDAIVSDAGLPVDYLEFLESNGVEVLLV